MKFLLLLAETDHFAKWDAADAAHRDRVVADFGAFHAAVSERGAIVAGEALDSVAAARTVQPADHAGPREATAGPYAETVEQMGGFYLIDVPDQDVACELASLLPREYLVEVRPVVDVDI